MQADDLARRMWYSMQAMCQYFDRARSDLKFEQLSSQEQRYWQAVAQDIIIDAPVQVTSEETVGVLRNELIALSVNNDDHKYTKDFIAGWDCAVKLWVMPTLNQLLGKEENDLEYDNRFRD
jgi:hypothetical protein